MTGFHSVMLRLRHVLASLDMMWNASTYPDSVSRVNPPNTTIPKTLAALPSSQYATVFELVSGKREGFCTALCASAAAARKRADDWNDLAWIEATTPLPLIGLEFVVKLTRALDLFNCGVGTALRRNGLVGCLWHGKNLFESVGAASRSARAKPDPTSVLLMLLIGEDCKQRGSKGKGVRCGEIY